jgi:hypothetical protein
MDKYLKLDEDLNSLLSAAIDNNWEEVEACSSAILEARTHMEEHVATKQKSFHDDETKLIISIRDKIKLLEKHILARMADLTVLTGNNATEMKLAKAYGG